jgi:hypothetical protein
VITSEIALRTFNHTGAPSPSTGTHLQPVRLPRIKECEATHVSESSVKARSASTQDASTVIYLWSVRVRLASRQHSSHTYEPNNNLVQARGFESLGGLCAPAGERALAAQLAVVGRRVFRVVVSSFGRNQRLVLGLGHACCESVAVYSAFQETQSGTRFERSWRKRERRSLEALGSRESGHRWAPIKVSSPLSSPHRLSLTLAHNVLISLDLL